MAPAVGRRTAQSEHKTVQTSHRKDIHAERNDISRGGTDHFYRLALAVDILDCRIRGRKRRGEIQFLQQNAFGCRRLGILRIFGKGLIHGDLRNRKSGVAVLRGKADRARGHIFCGNFAAENGHGQNEIARGVFHRLAFGSHFHFGAVDPQFEF